MNLQVKQKINYKTKGLWTGSWKGRRISPMNTIKWTSADEKNLGIYFENDKPGFKNL